MTRAPDFNPEESVERNFIFEEDENLVGLKIFREVGYFPLYLNKILTSKGKKY